MESIKILSISIPRGAEGVSADLHTTYEWNHMLNMKCNNVITSK